MKKLNIWKMSFASDVGFFFLTLLCPSCSKSVEVLAVSRVRLKNTSAGSEVSQSL